MKKFIKLTANLIEELGKSMDSYGTVLIKVYKSL